MKLKQKTAWGWITLIYVSQIVGSLGVAMLFRMDFKELYAAILLLVTGAVLGAIFYARSESREFGEWQWWIPVLIYALFIFSLSNRSYPDAQPLFDTKVFHPLEYVVLGIFICLVSLQTLRRKGILSFSGRVLSIGVLFGASDELHQAFIPGRTPRITDVLFWDLLGILLAWVGILIIRRFYAKSRAR